MQSEDCIVLLRNRWNGVVVAVLATMTSRPATVAETQGTYRPRVRVSCPLDSCTVPAGCERRPLRCAYEVRAAAGIRLSRSRDRRADATHPLRLSNDPPRLARVADSIGSAAMRFPFCAVVTGRTQRVVSREPIDRVPALFECHIDVRQLCACAAPWREPCVPGPAADNID